MSWAATRLVHRTWSRTRVKKYMSLTFVVLSTDNEASRLIKAALSAGPNTRLVAEAQTPERLFSDVQLLRPSGVILVLSPAPTDAEFGMIKKIVTTHPGTAVITA